MVDVANFAARNFGQGPDLAQIDLARNRNALAQQELQMGPLRQQYMQQQIDTGAAHEQALTAQDQAQKIQWLHGASQYALQHPEAWGYVVDEGKKRGIIPPDFNAPHDPQKLQDFVNQVEVMQGGGPPPKQTVVPAGGALMQEGSAAPLYVNPKDEPQPTVHAVLDPKTGRPVYVSAKDALGREPFNPTSGTINDNNKEMAYQQFLATGKIPTVAGRSAAANIALTNYVADRAAAEGQTAAAAAAKRQSYEATQGVIKEFQSTRPGTAGGQLSGINTAVAHMDSLMPLIDALGTGDLKAINKIRNTYQEQTGNPAPTNFQALKEFVSGEVAKAVLPGGGGELERKALSAPLDQANSPLAIRQAVETIQTALAGKTEALRNQWDISTNGTQGQFDKFLLPATKRALKLDSGAPATPANRPTQIQSDEEYNALPSGAQYVAPDGSTRTKR